jgi:hypothetical protein
LDINLSSIRLCLYAETPVIAIVLLENPPIILHIFAFHRILNEINVFFTLVNVFVSLRLDADVPFMVPFMQSRLPHTVLHENHMHHLLHEIAARIELVIVHMVALLSCIGQTVVTLQKLHTPLIESLTLSFEVDELTIQLIDFLCKFVDFGVVAGLLRRLFNLS